MAARTIVQPSVMPVPLEEFRRHLWNIYDDHDSDELMLDLLVAATDNAEARLGRKLITRTMQVEVDGSGMVIVLPFGDFQQVVGWDYDLNGGTAVVGDLSELGLGLQGVLAEVRIPYIEGASKTRIRWRCGYGDAPADVPGDIRMAIKQLAAHWYTNRAAAVQEGETGRVVTTPFTYSALLHSYRLNFVPDR